MAVTEEQVQCAKRGSRNGGGRRRIQSAAEEEDGRRPRLRKGKRRAAATANPDQRIGAEAVGDGDGGHRRRGRRSSVSRAEGVGAGPGRSRTTTSSIRPGSGGGGRRGRRIRPGHAGIWASGGWMGELGDGRSRSARSTRGVGRDLAATVAWGERWRGERQRRVDIWRRRRGESGGRGVGRAGA